MSATLKDLAEKAVHCLLAQQAVEITHKADWLRSGFPLPIKRQPPSLDGTKTQQYRPMALLEYINDTLGAEATARRAAECKTAAGDTA